MTIGHNHEQLLGHTPSVSVIHPQASAPNQEIMLPGYTQAFTDTPVFARTSGYLKSWRFDIGAHVSGGSKTVEIGRVQSRGVKGSAVHDERHG
jgi:hypothetical protein